MRKLFKSNKAKTVTIALLFVLVVSAVISLGVRLGQSQTYAYLGHDDYVVGTLDNTGAFTKNGGSFVTEDYYEVDGLAVTVKENAELSYKLYFFNEDKEFISATNNFCVTYNGVIPEDAAFFKISIDPTNDDDISIYDIMNFSSQVEVKYYK